MTKRRSTTDAQRNDCDLRIAAAELEDAREMLRSGDKPTAVAKLALAARMIDDVVDRHGGV